MIKSLIWLLLLTTTFTTNVSENRINIRVEEAIPANGQYVMKIFSTHPITDIEWFYDKDEIKCVIDSQGAVCLISPKEDIKGNFLSIWYDKSAVELPVMFDFSSSDNEVKPSPEIITSDDEGIFPNKNERVYQGEESTSLYNVSVTLDEMNNFMENKKLKTEKVFVEETFPEQEKKIKLNTKRENIVQEEEINDFVFSPYFLIFPIWFVILIVIIYNLLKNKNRK